MTLGQKPEIGFTEPEIGFIANNESVGKTAFLLEVLGGESVSFPFLNSKGCLHSLALWPFPLSSEHIITTPASFVTSPTADSSSCLPLRRTPVIALGPPSQSMVICPFQDSFDLFFTGYNCFITSC